MPSRTQTLAGRAYRFDSLRELLAKASPARAGDELSGVAAHDPAERMAAQLCLADVALSDFLIEPVIDYDTDEVTRLILDAHDPVVFAPVSHLTVGGLRDHLLGHPGNPADLASGLTPEMVAAVSKLMSNQDLIRAAHKCSIVTSFRNTLGLPRRFSSRLQPNSPTDDPLEIAAATVEGLTYGVGDAVIGINPATDSVRHLRDLLLLLDDVVQRFAIPTQTCVLAHVTSTIEAIGQGAPVDLTFQSIAGTQAANRSFGIDLSLLREAHEATLSLNRGTVGNNVMYFETGQGSCLSAGADHGVDQQTLEARAYAVAREFDPLLVNTVVGFIGPEYLYDGRQIRRAGLEDHFCGKLLGLPMGCDVCYTNHADADQNDADDLLTLLAVAGCTYVMGVPGTDDVMLEYQSTSFQDVATTRELLGLRPSPEFEQWLIAQDLMNPSGELSAPHPGHPLLAVTAR